MKKFEDYTIILEENVEESLEERKFLAFLKEIPQASLHEFGKDREDAIKNLKSQFDFFSKETLSSFKVSLAQIKTVTGDLEGNTNKIINEIENALADNSDFIIFPELAITGYCCGALFDQMAFIKYNERFLKEKIVPEVKNDLVAIVGYVELVGKRKNGFPAIKNSVAIIQNQKIIGTYSKMILANGDHHEDKKYFIPGDFPKVFEVNIKGKNVTFGVPICEDAWNIHHNRDIVNEMVQNGAEIIFCPNQSYFYYGKQNIRKNLFYQHSVNHRIPVITVNAVGIGDIVKNIMVFDGGSLIFDSEGQKICECKRFEEDYQTRKINISKNSNSCDPCMLEPKTISEKTKNEEILKALIFVQKESFDLIGFKKVQVHLSGGIDSAIVAYLVKEAFGSENCIFETNPTRYNSKKIKDLAYHVANKLKIPLKEFSTEEIYNTTIQEFQKTFPDLEMKPIAKSSLQANIRTAQGIFTSNNTNTGIIATGNHTEIVEGWATFHDIGSVGVMSLIGDLTKVELFSLASFINEINNDEIIPKSLYNGEILPAAELVDANIDPFDYFIRSGIDAEMIRNKKDPITLINDFKNKNLYMEFFPKNWNNKIIYDFCSLEQFEKEVWSAFYNARRSVYKAAQTAPSVIISPRSRGFSNRETIFNKYQGFYNF
jgi:NAD+ synthetase